MLLNLGLLRFKKMKTKNHIFPYYAVGNTMLIFGVKGVINVNSFFLQTPSQAKSLIPFERIIFGKGNWKNLNLLTLISS